MELVNIFGAYKKELAENDGVIVIYRNHNTWQFNSFNLAKENRNTLAQWLRNILGVDNKAIFINLFWCGLEHFEDEPEALANAAEKFYIKNVYSVFDLIEFVSEGVTFSKPLGRISALKFLASVYEIFDDNLKLSFGSLMNGQTQDNLAKFKEEFEIISNDFIRAIDKIFEGIEE